jgi:hypothetical protein
MIKVKQHKKALAFGCNPLFYRVVPEEGFSRTTSIWTRVFVTFWVMQKVNRIISG